MGKKKENSAGGIQFFHDYSALPVPLKRLQATTDAIIHEKKLNSKKQVNVIFCSDYKIRTLNNEYRKKNKPTDVLSFPFDDKDLLGEIYISLQRAAVQARRFKVSYADEVNRLFVHGLFHLLGYNHLTEKERLAMESLERRFA